MKRAFLVRLRLSGAFVALAAFLPFAANAQVSPLLRLDTIQVAPGNPVQFTFSDTGSGATNYVVEFSPAVGSGGAWSNVSGAVISPLGSSNYHVITPAPQTANGFFRVRGLGGALHHQCHGGVRGFHFALRRVLVNGTTAPIPITLTDNKLIGQLKFLTLTLEAGAGYQLGATSQNTINILENDADWQGSFISDDATIGFVLRIQESNGMHLASVKCDGFGLFPTNETPASITFNTNFFSATAQNMSIPPSRRCSIPKCF